MFNILKKIIVVISVLLFFFFVTFLIAAWYHGAFASVKKVTLSKRDRIVLVTTNDSCLPYKVNNHLQYIDSLLIHANISYNDKVMLFQNNPLTVRPDSLLSRGAMVLNDSIAVDSPLVLLILPERKAAVTSIEAHPLIVPYKAYPAIQRWLNNNGYRYNRMFPIIEYNSRGIVEIEMPVVTDSLQKHLPLKEQ
jgi:hypothetical protein